MTLITVETVVLLMALVTICLCCAFLVFHEDYEDGLLGRLSMVAIMLGAGMLIARLFGSREGWGADIDPAGEIMIVGLAAFMCRHVWRFLRALHDPSFHWKRNNDDGINTQMGEEQ